MPSNSIEDLLNKLELPEETKDIEVKDSTVRETFAVCSSLQPAKEFIAGVELEIEDFKATPQLPMGWNNTEDGSLRNSGRELISPPLGLSTHLAHFGMIHKNIKLGKEPFTERTSIHVHINCLDLTQEQCKSVVLWYALFEPVFFAMVAPHRRNNIHCVGLDQTVLSEYYRRSLPIIVDKWSKYTALNLLPLKTQGTIEFRHMQGHNNQTLYTEWMWTLNNLWKWGQEYILKRQQVDDVKILAAFDYIFRDATIKSIRPSVLDLIADNVLDVKLSLV